MSFIQSISTKKLRIIMHKLKNAETARGLLVGEQIALGNIENELSGRVKL